MSAPATNSRPRPVSTAARRRGSALERVERALEVVERRAAERVGRRHVDRHQRDELRAAGAHRIDAHAHGRAVDEARAPRLVHLARGARAVESGGRRRRARSACPRGGSRGSPGAPRRARPSRAPPAGGWRARRRRAGGRPPRPGGRWRGGCRGSRSVGNSTRFCASRRWARRTRAARSAVPSR